MERIKGLLDRYYELRAAVQRLQEDGKATIEKLVQDPHILALQDMDVTRSDEWTTFLSKQRAPPPQREITLSQIRSALIAKWKSPPPLKTMLMVVESAQIMHHAVTAETKTALNVLQNETLYNLTLESPLLRDADILDEQSIAATWRGSPPSKLTFADVDASLRKGELLKEWVTKKVSEGETLLNEANDKLLQMRLLEREGQMLETLGDNVL